MQKSISKYAVIGASMLIGTGATAFAAEWQTSTMYDDDGAPWGAALTIQTDGRENSLGFRCMDGKLLAAISLNGSDLIEAFSDAGRQKSLDVDLTIGADETMEDEWLYLPRHGVVASGDYALAARLYNAASRGEEISIDAGRRGAAVIAQSDVNAAAFSEFARTCGLAKKAG